MDYICPIKRGRLEIARSALKMWNVNERLNPICRGWFRRRDEESTIQQTILFFLSATRIIQSTIPNREAPCLWVFLNIVYFSVVIHFVEYIAAWNNWERFAVATDNLGKSVAGQVAWYATVIKSQSPRETCVCTWARCCDTTDLLTRWGATLCHNQWEIYLGKRATNASNVRQREFDYVHGFRHS